MKDQFTTKWIIDNAQQICSRYDDGVLTLRSLHYQLVGIGMTNDINHYKRVVNSMIQARWDGIISFEKFSDLDRRMEGHTRYEETDVEESIEQAKDAIKNWMTLYYKNRWENQPYFVEVLIEKKALQGVFSPECAYKSVGMGACKGYPSLTFLNDAAKRYQTAIDAGKKVVIIYFGDYDPSGEDIPRSIAENIGRFGVDITIDRIALMEDQVIEWKLPPAPVKDSDTRAANWDGLGQVELDAVKPEMLRKLCADAIDKYFDDDLYDDLKQTQAEERIIYRQQLKEFVNGLSEE